MELLLPLILLVIVEGADEASVAAAAETAAATIERYCGPYLDCNIK